MCITVLCAVTDGDNASSDRADAETALGEIAALANYAGYLEVSADSTRRAQQRMRRFVQIPGGFGQAGRKFRAQPV